MKLIALLAFALSVVGCSNGFKSASTPSTAPLNINTRTSLDAGQVSIVSSSVSRVLTDISLSLQDLSSVDLNGNGANLSLNETVACPLGGTVAVSANGTLALNVSLPSITASLGDSAASLTFTNCALQDSIVLNGNVSGINVQGASNATLSLSGSSTFTASGSNQFAGNLQVTAGSINETCAFSLSNSMSATGTFNITSASQSGNVTAQVIGSACGVAVNQQITRGF